MAIFPPFFFSQSALTGGDLGRQRQGWRLKSGSWAAGEGASDPGNEGMGFGGKTLGLHGNSRDFMGYIYCILFLDDVLTFKEILVRFHGA